MTTKTKTAWLSAGSSTAIAAAIALSSAAPAMAQSTGGASAAAPQGATDAQVVVTGSRIVRSGFTTPVPVTVVGQDLAQQQAATSVATVVQDLPEFRPQQNQTSASAAVQNVGAATADLRGLGANRTLVLLDGERLVGDTVPAPLGATAADAVDLNLIPSNMVLRTEIVTGGASASYGSDAVAGVVNMILDNKMNGIKAGYQHSVTGVGDMAEDAINLAVGHDFLGGKAHVVFGGEWIHNGGIPNRLANGRTWAEQQNLPATVQNPCPGVTGAGAHNLTCPNGGNGLPANIVGVNPENALYTSGGVIMPTGLPGGANNPLAFLNFNTPTDVAPLVKGYWLGKGAGMMGGQGPNGFNEFFPLAVPDTHYSMYLHANYDFSDSLSAHISVLYGDNQSYQQSLQPRWFGTSSTGQSGINYIWINPDNAFLPASIQPQITALAAAQAALKLPQGFNLGSVPDVDGPEVIRNDRRSYRFSGGFDGKYNFIGDKAWTWNAYATYSETDYHWQADNSVNWKNSDKAFDAVVVNAANQGTSGLPIGQIVCRSTLTAPTNGCVPMNPFGEAAPGPDARAYAFGTQYDNTKRSEYSFAFSTQGDIFTLPAGPVSLAVGGEYRSDSLSGQQDAISSGTNPGGTPGVNGWQIASASIGNGSMDVKEGFAELAIPILKDVMLFKNFNADLAARETDYNLSGAVTTWKAGLTDDVTSWFRLRGTMSRDIRAPNVWDLFTTQLRSNVIAADPITGNPFALATTGGNPNLKPEVAWTVTGGFVVTAPSDTFMKGLRFSVDYNKIKLNDAITSVTPSIIVSNCALAHNASNCALITRDPVTNAITNIEATNVNIASIRSASIDVELDYRRTLADFVSTLPGSLDLHVFGTHTMQDTQEVTGANTYLAGVAGGVPWWDVHGYLTYNVGNLSVGGTMHFISSSIVSTTLYAPCQGANYTNAMAAGALSTTSFNCVGAYATFGLNSQYNIDYKGGRITLYMTIDNLFDRPPPFDVAGTGNSTGSAPNYDLFGRNFHFGVKFRY